jgi:hypothetical protein
MKKTVIAILTIFLILTTLAVLNDNEKETLLLPQPKEDFTNPEEGSVVMLTSVPNLNVPEKIKYVVFFKSRFFPGLSIQYNIPKLSLEAGIPLMGSPETDIVGRHIIVYTYQKKGTQSLYLDGNKIASGAFIGKSISPPVGYVVLNTENIKYINPEKVEMYDRELTEEEIKNL